MKKEEKQYLKTIHNPEEFNRIQQIEISQKFFKVLKKEYKKALTKIKNQEKEIEKLKNQIKTKKMQHSIIKINPVKKNIGKEIFLKDITKTRYERCKLYIRRIEENLQQGEDYSKTRIIKELMIPYKEIEFCLAFLESEGRLDKRMIDGTMKWRLK